MSEYGPVPYDLAPVPPRVIVPRYRCADSRHDVREAALGGEGATLARHDYGRCRRGCCEAVTRFILKVPCDSLPHCMACECGSEHIAYLSDEHVRDLKALLP